MNLIQNLESDIIELKEKEKKIKEEIEHKKRLLFLEYNREVKPELMMVHLPDDIEDTVDAEAYLTYRYPFYEIDGIEVDSGIAYLRPPADFVKFSSGRIERRVANPTPVVDLEKLKSLDAKLYDRVTSSERVFDSDKFDELVEEDPSVLGAIEQCLIAQKPRVSLHIVGEK